MIKLKLIVHNTTSPFTETYIDLDWAVNSGHFPDQTREQVLHSIAKTIVGKGLPYWEVDWDELNDIYDEATRDAWVLDPDALGTPDGYGERDV